MKELGIVHEKSELGPWLKQIPMWEELNAEQKKMEIRRMEIYSAMIENIDHHVGRVLQYLESSGKKKDTLVVFSLTTVPMVLKWIVIRVPAKHG
jgi:arylsulfatase A-like enzyme